MLLNVNKGLVVVKAGIMYFRDHVGAYHAIAAVLLNDMELYDLNDNDCVLPESLVPKDVITALV